MSGSASQGASRRLGVIVAVEAEAAAILADARFAWEKRAPGEFESRTFPVNLALCGVGKAFASWSIAVLARRCSLIVSLGTAGSLGSEAAGSLHLVKEFVEYDMLAAELGFESGVTPFAGMQGPVISSLSPECEAIALAALEAAGLKAPWARSASGDRFIGDAAEARRLRESTGATLCDMESAAMAKLCLYRAKADFFSLRSVSDNADHAAHASWAEQAKASALVFDAYLGALARAWLASARLPRGHEVGKRLSPRFRAHDHAGATTIGSVVDSSMAVVGEVA